MNTPIADLSLYELSDGSGCGFMSLPLPKDHWIYETSADGFTGPPPMPMRMGNHNPLRDKYTKEICAAARYAIKASTRCGREQDFDPDAMERNFIIGLLGYFTPDGLSSNDWANPANIPAEVGLENYDQEKDMIHKCYVCGEYLPDSFSSNDTANAWHTINICANAAGGVSQAWRGVHVKCDPCDVTSISTAELNSLRKEVLELGKLLHEAAEANRIRG